MIRHIQRRFDDIALGAAVLGVASLGLALFAFTRPTTRQAHVETRYTQSGAFAYAAEAAAPDLYDGGSAVTGDPVFSRQSDLVNVRYTYRFATETAHTVSGTGTLSAELAEASGWKRTLALAAPTAFSGDEQSLTGVLRLSDLTVLMERFKEQTGITRPQFTLTLRSATTGDGVVAETPFAVAFAPSLAFILDEFGLRLAPHDVREASPLTPSSEEFVGGSRAAANRIALLGVGLSVLAARALSIAGLLVSALGAVALYFLFRRREGSAAIDDATARYGRIIVRGRDVPVEKVRPLAVQSLDDLVRVAQAEQTVVVAVEHRGVTTYTVRTVAGAYSYASTGDALHQVAA